MENIQTTLDSLEENKRETSGACVDTRARMKELIQLLNEAAHAYYSTDTELMSNLQYDRLYDELSRLEAETGVILAGSPTQRIGYEVVSELPKIRHQKPMMSLDKTKNIEALAAFLGDRRGILSWKLDGLTLVLTYENGELVQAATRGNGEIGEVITANARVFHGVPLKIPYTGHLVVRGEALISYRDFERINQNLPSEEQYKNPRNLCSGSVRQLDSRIAKERNVTVVIYTMIESDKPASEFHDSKEEQLSFLQQMGFDPVEHKMVTGQSVAAAEKEFTSMVDKVPFPVDGLVLTLDSIEESASLGTTAKFPRDSMAFKWQDEQAKTILRSIEWSPSRTGLINPVAIFDPVELEGTTVQRASLHNVSILRELKLGIGDEILVYKANMIIPQISENITKSNTASVPDTCPRCGGKTQIETGEDVSVLICTNPSCPAKSLKALEHFVSREAMNIEGLSEATLERMSEEGFLESFADLYRLKEHKEAICEMEGFGERSCEKLLMAIEKSRSTELYRLLCGLGVPGIGAANARVLSDAFSDDLTKIREASTAELSVIDGIGPVLAKAITEFFNQPQNKEMVEDLMQYITVEKKEIQEQTLSGKTFVITGSLEHFENRDALKNELIKKGAKVAGSVSKNTDYLVNNDRTSTSSKNKKAAELNIPVLSEEDVLQMLNG